MLTCSSCRSHRASCFSNSQCFNIFSRANRWLSKSFPLKTFHFFHNMWVQVQNSVLVRGPRNGTCVLTCLYTGVSNTSHFSTQQQDLFLSVEDSYPPCCSSNHFSTVNLQFSTFICSKVHSAIKFVITSCPTFPNSFAATNERHFWFMA